LFQRAVQLAGQLDQSIAARLEQPAVDITGMTGSMGEMASFSHQAQSHPNAISNQPVAGCPSCGRMVLIRQRRPSQQQPLTEVNTNQSERIRKAPPLRED
uniref:Transposase n=1 Tax=Echinostoma caproni TaxID=27848 RepID=A0A183AZJ8_9TREM